MSPRNFGFIKISIILTIFVTLQFRGTCGLVTFEQDVSLTELQVKALAEFKERMLPKIKQDYMKEDIYLVKFLRSKKFDVEKAVTMLNTFLAWRESTNFDKLTNEDFTDLATEYPYEVLGVDNEGKPLLQWYYSDWDVRKAAVGGNMERLNVYIAKMFDNAWLKVRDLQKEGKNVTRFVIVLDMEKINLLQHLTPSCMPIYINTVLAYDRYFPKQGDDVYLINTPGLFEVGLNLAKSVMDQDTKNSLQVFGQNKQQWMTALYKNVDPTQLTHHYGGTMPSKFDS